MDLWYDTENTTGGVSVKFAALLMLAIFYGIYLGKMLHQRRQGIQTDQIARGKVKDRVFYTELVMKIATYGVVVVEIISILTRSSPRLGLLSGFGLALGFIGDGIFAAAVFAMHDSWRAGIAVRDKTKMVCSGIYRISRNPAFLGFDCVYVGILLPFFNFWLLVWSVFAMVMLHLQILQEEAYLSQAFGQAYLDYRGKVRRYLGRK